MAAHRVALRGDIEDSANGRPEPPAPFRLEVHPARDVVRICPLGEVDLETVGTVGEQIEELRAAGFTRLVLDLRGVTFLDSTGLHLAIEAHAASRAEGWEFALIEGPAHVQRVFEVTGSRAALTFVTASQLSTQR